MRKPVRQFAEYNILNLKIYLWICWECKIRGSERTFSCNTVKMTGIKYLKKMDGTEKWLIVTGPKSPPLSLILLLLLALLPSKHDTLKQCWGNIGPPSATLAQRYTNIVSMCRVCWVLISLLFLLLLLQLLLLLLLLLLFLLLLFLLLLSLLCCCPCCCCCCCPRCCCCVTFIRLHHWCFLEFDRMLVHLLADPSITLSVGGRDTATKGNHLTSSTRHNHHRGASTSLSYGGLLSINLTCPHQYSHWFIWYITLEKIFGILYNIQLLPMRMFWQLLGQLYYN